MFHFTDPNSSTTEIQKDLLLDNVVRKVRNTVAQFGSEHRDIHSSVSRVGKTIDKNFVSDYFCVGNEAMFDEPENAKILNKVIVEHFLRQGKSDIAEKLIEEANLDVDNEEKTPYIKINKILGKCIQTVNRLVSFFSFQQMP